MNGSRHSSLRPEPPPPHDRDGVSPPLRRTVRRANRFLLGVIVFGLVIAAAAAAILRTMIELGYSTR